MDAQQIRGFATQLIKGEGIPSGSLVMNCRRSITFLDQLAAELVLAGCRAQARGLVEALIDVETVLKQCEKKIDA